MVAKARKQEKKTIDPVLPEDSSPEVEIPELKKDMKPFDVRECALISLATGVSVQTLREFREALLTVHPSSVYHHFWGRLLQPHFDEPEYNNDFAGWAIHGLDDRSLAERLAVIDPTDYGDMRTAPGGGDRYRGAAVGRERAAGLDQGRPALSFHQGPDSGSGQRSQDQRTGPGWFRPSPRCPPAASFITLSTPGPGPRTGPTTSRPGWAGTDTNTRT